MSFTAKTPELLARARVDMRMGLPVVIAGSGSAILVLSAETVDDQALSDLAMLQTPIALSITARRAQTLKVRTYDGDLARIQLPSGARAAWVRDVADPADDLARPLKGPLTALRDGTVDLHRVALKLLKSARLLPAALVAELPDAVGFAAHHGLTLLQSDATNDALDAENQLDDVVHARLPIAASGAGRLHVFRPKDGGEEHYAIEIGSPPRDAPVLARLHSACFTGDVLGSLKCDCGPQLGAALAQMGAEGAGILLYLNQEGRGIGLANKMRAYSLQDQGFDTVEANHRLGFEDDERDFRLGSEILKSLGFSQIRLLTNNPAKIAMMQETGITVTEHVPLRVGETAQNRAYLATKAAKSGHLL